MGFWQHVADDDGRAAGIDKIVHDQPAFAVAFDELGAFTLAAVVLFLFNAFFIADAYVWRRGGFEWD